MTIGRSILVLSLIAAMVSGCGGGGGGGGSPPTAPGPFPINETEPNDFVAQSVGTLATADIRVSGSTSSARDVDLYRVIASAPVTLFVSLDWNTASDLELTISNADGVFVREVDTLGHPESCSLAGLPAGTYTVRVGSFTNVATAYTLTIGHR